MILKPMSKFVLEQNEEQDYTADFEKVVVRYAKLLCSNKHLSMCVPCDSFGDYLEEPSNLDRMRAYWADNPIDENFYRVRDYDIALKEIIFKGFEVVDYHKGLYTTIKHEKGNVFTYDHTKGQFINSSSSIIESWVDLGFELTPQAVRKIFK